MHFKNSMKGKTLPKIFSVCACLFWKADRCARIPAEWGSQTPFLSTLARLPWQMCWNREQILVFLTSSAILPLNPAGADIARRGPYARLQSPGSWVSHNLLQWGSSPARPSAKKALRDRYSPGMYLPVNFHPPRTLLSTFTKWVLCRRAMFHLCQMN